MSLFRHERIRTTLAKAKEYRPRAEKVITLAKVDTVARRRRAFALLRDKAVVKRLFEEIAPRFQDRPGGYTRILKFPRRRVGDDAPVALLELLPGPEGAAAAAEEAEEEKGRGKKKRRRRKKGAAKEKA